MYEADIRHDGIFGLDFLIDHDYTLGAKTGLRLNRKKYPCVLEKTSYNSKVVCSDMINVPASNEIVISGKAETLPLPSTSETLPVRIMNTSKDDIIIKKGTVLGKEEVIKIPHFANEKVEDIKKLCTKLFKGKQYHGKETITRTFDGAL